MAWPDVSRKLWSYVITKLGLFTNVDPSKLEVSSTSLKLNNVAVDHTKVELPGLSITQCVVQKLSLELNSSGLSINAIDLQINATVDSVEQPELAISTLMETSMNSLAQLGRNDEIEPQGSTSGLVAKLADMALSQISLRVSEIHLSIEMPAESELRVIVEEITMSSKHQFEVESVSIYRVSYTEEECFSDAASTSSAEDPKAVDVMAQSVYLDAASSWRDLDVKRTETVEHEQMLSYLDHMSLHYHLNPAELRINAEKVRIDGFESLDMLVTLFNSAVYKSESVPTQVPDAKDHTQQLIIMFDLSRIELYESFDNTAQPILIEDVAFRPSEFEIGGLRVPGVLELSPFLTVKIVDRLVIDIPTPLSASLPLELVPTAYRIFEKLAHFLTRLATPEDAEPALFTLNIPEMRVSLGTIVVLNIFPQSGSEEALELREITLTLSDNQLMLSNIKIDMQGRVSIKSLRLKLVSSIREDLALIAASLGPAPELHRRGSASDIHSTKEREKDDEAGKGLSLPNFEIVVERIDIEEIENSVKLSGNLKFSSLRTETTLEVQSQNQFLGYFANIELTANSRDGLKSVNAKLRCRNLKLPLRQLESSVTTEGVEEEPNKTYLDGLPNIVIDVLNEDEVELDFEDAKLTARIDHMRLKVIGGVVAARVPRLYVDAVDPRNEARIPVLKLKNMTVLLRKSLQVDVEGLFLTTCADSYDYVVGLIGRLTPTPRLPEYQTEPDRDLDVLNALIENEFVELNSSYSNVSDEAHVSVAKSLKIEEDYMSNRAITTLNPNADDHLLTSKVSSEKVQQSSSFTIRRLKWHLHDGYDFQHTRDNFKEAIKKISSAARNMEETSDGEDESPIVGDFMYNSILITVPASRATDLGSDIAEQLGSTTGLERSVDPKLVLTLRNLRISSQSRLSSGLSDPTSTTTITVNDGNVADLLASSHFNFVISPAESGNRGKIFSLALEAVGAPEAPETRSRLHISPLRLSLDQDTLEFIVRFFQFSDEEEVEDTKASNNQDFKENERIVTFLQRFEFGELPLVLDYNPKKLNYKSLRSGIAAELLNVFAVKGAKIMLQSSVLYGINGWDGVYTSLLQQWLPDVRENQLLGLISGIGPVRRAVRVSKGVTRYTIVPLRHQQIGRGTSVVVRRTIDELLRMGASWFESTDSSLDAG